MKPIIFLDFDGVLNTMRTACKRPLETEALDIEMVQRLAILCTDLDAEVVVSSSWLAKQIGVTQMTKQRPPKQLDAIVDVVLAYRPKAKSKPARRRKRRAAKIAKGK